jgi:ribosomal protein S18 acetylase RimI-like enzyme
MTEINDAMTLSITRLSRSQTHPAATALSAAFHADPVMRYFIPADPTAYQPALRQISQGMIRLSQPYDQIYTTAGEVKGIAAWLPPEVAVVDLSQLWHLLMSGLLTVPLRLRWQRWPDLLAYVRQTFEQRQRHGAEPHWYLMMLGVAPADQGQGIGGKLLAPILHQADRDQTSCYLETSTESAVRFYRRHGFAVMDVIMLAKGLPYWIMKRQPQAQQE